MTTDEPTTDPIAVSVNDAVLRFTQAFAGIPDATDRARATGAALDSIPTLQRGLREIRQDAVQEMRAAGHSHAEVARALGISRARAQQIAEGRTSGKRADKEDKE